MRRLTSSPAALDLLKGDQALSARAPQELVRVENALQHGDGEVSLRAAAADGGESSLLAQAERRGAGDQQARGREARLARKNRNLQKKLHHARKGKVVQRNARGVTARVNVCRRGLKSSVPPSSATML